MGRDYGIAHQPEIHGERSWDHLVGSRVVIDRELFYSPSCVPDIPLADTKHLTRAT